MVSLRKLSALVGLLGVATASLKLDFSVEKRLVNPKPRSGPHRRDAVGSNIQNAQYASLYLINVAVGSPPQPITLQIDTGSDEVWFPWIESDFCSASNTSSLCSEGVFDPSKSTTYTSVAPNGFSISYQDHSGDLGDYFLDQFYLADQPVNGLVMGLAKEIVQPPAQTGGVIEGLLGVGPKLNTLNTSFTYPGPGILPLMQSQGLISSRAYSLWLNDLNADTGSVLFGAVDKAKYQGELVALPNQPATDSGFLNRYTIVLDNIGLSYSNYTVSLGTNLAAPAIPDSGTTLMKIPEDAFAALSKLAGVQKLESQGVYYLPCDSADRFDRNDAAVTFGFGGADGPQIKVPVSSLVMPIDPSEWAQVKNPTNDTPVCGWGATPGATDGAYILGDAFMRSAYFVYDLDNEVIAIAQTAGPQAIDNVDIQEITGDGIPGCTSTATGTYASSYALYASPAVGTGSAAPSSNGTVYAMPTPTSQGFTTVISASGTGSVTVPPA